LYEFESGQLTPPRNETERKLSEVNERYFFLGSGQIHRNVNSMRSPYGPLSSQKLHAQKKQPRRANSKENHMDHETYITEAELAKRLKVSKSTLHKLREEGDLPYQMIGTCIRYSTDTVENWLNTKRFNQEMGEQNNAS